MLTAPFPWFGGKSRVADIVWDRFGDVANYVEPFFGSGAVLLARPHPPRIETVNDLDCMVANKAHTQASSSLRRITRSIAAASHMQPMPIVSARFHSQFTARFIVHPSMSVSAAPAWTGA